MSEQRRERGEVQRVGRGPGVPAAMHSTGMGRGRALHLPPRLEAGHQSRMDSKNVTIEDESFRKVTLASKGGLRKRAAPEDESKHRKDRIVRPVEPPAG